MVGNEIDTLLLDDEPPNTWPILVLAYEPSCPVCKEIAPDFIQLADILAQ